MEIVHLAVGAWQQLDDAVGHAAVRTDEVLHQSDGRAFLGHDDRVMHPRQLARTLADDGLERLLDHDVARHIDERAAGPQRVVERAELVLVGRHGRAEVALHQLRVLPRGGVQVAEDDPAGGETGVKLVLCGRAIDDRQRPDAFDLGQAFRHLGRQDPRCGPTADRLILLEFETRQLGAPPCFLGAGGPRDLLKEAPCLQAQIEHPRGLVLRLRKGLDGRYCACGECLCCHVCFRCSRAGYSGRGTRYTGLGFVIPSPWSPDP